MLVVALAGSIGMGKTTVAARLRQLSIAVFDADAEVHALYEGAAVAPIESAFAGTTAAGRVDRDKLSKALLANPAGFAKLEAIVHPLVLASERAFLKAEMARGAKMAVLEIPLLFETGGQARVDAVIVASAPADAQRQRVLGRPGMNPQKLEQLLGRQVPDAEKRARADFVVDTGGTFEESDTQVDKIVESLQGRTGTAFAKYWS
jgi:dephospho-CoA kinase